MPLIQIMQEAPLFESECVLHDEVAAINLADFKGKYVVLLFYVLDFSPKCTEELALFNDRIKKFQELKTELLAISTDSAYTHLAWTKGPRTNIEIGAIDIKLVTDFSNEICYDYGTLCENSGTAHRALFILDRDLIVRYILFNDRNVKRNVEEVIRILEVLQKHDSE